jgi:hypothetical protein
MLKTKPAADDWGPMSSSTIPVKGAKIEHYHQPYGQFLEMMFSDLK